MRGIVTDKEFCQIVADLESLGALGKGMILHWIKRSNCQLYAPCEVESIIADLIGHFNYTPHAVIEITAEFWEVYSDYIKLARIGHQIIQFLAVKGDSGLSVIAEHIGQNTAITARFLQGLVLTGHVRATRQNSVYARNYDKPTFLSALGHL